MHEYYRIPTMALLAVLTTVFFWLYFRARTYLRLMWLLGWAFTLLHLVAESSGWWHRAPGLAVTNLSMELAALMFLGSLSPLSIGRSQLRYIHLFSVTLVLFTLLVSFYPRPSMMMHAFLIVLTIAAAAVCIIWGAQKNLLPPWLTLSYSLAAGGWCVYLTWTHDYLYTLYAAETANNLMTALLFVAAWRRLSPGIVLTVAGLITWCAPGVLDGPFLSHGLSVLAIARIANLAKIVTGLGMVVLVLEDELAANDASKLRDHRARLELEEYAKIYISVIPGLEQQVYDRICRAISTRSRFSQVALLLRSVDGLFYTAASAEIAPPVLQAIDSFARQAGVAEIEQLAAAQTPNAFLPGQYNGMVLRSSAGVVEGLLLLGGLRDSTAVLLADELLPLELLGARLAAVRESGTLMQRLLRAEKLSGLGQLAGGVAHELNNPLTAVLGYAQMIEESAAEESTRRNASIIRQESRRMKQTIESLIRFWRPQWENKSPLAIGQMLADIERLRGPELGRNGIRLQIRVSDELPLVAVNADHMIQAIVQLIGNSAAALESVPEDREKRILIDASHANDSLRIVVSDTGRGFPDLNRVFDPFDPGRQGEKHAGMGLGVCYSIVREHGGDITAVNLHPYGAAIVIELPCPEATAPAPSAVTSARAAQAGAS